ncbi:hypothetical protein QCD79_33195, partial [Pseudomonas quasicaspiana]|nr:hypothetical protein [Pseudomonas quasicaspiana]
LTVFGLEDHLVDEVTDDAGEEHYKGVHHALHQRQSHHVANGDMVTLALVQGVVNTFVMFFARIIGNFVDKVI